MTYKEAHQLAYRLALDAPAKVVLSQYGGWAVRYKGEIHGSLDQVPFDIEAYRLRIANLRKDRTQ